MIRRAWLLSLVLYVASFAVSSGQLNHINLSQKGNTTSLYITIHGSFTHKLFTLTNPDRVVLDFSGAQLRYPLSQLSNGMIKHVRSGSPNKNTLRLVIDVNQRVQVKTAPWNENGQLRGIRIDLAGNSAYADTKKYNTTKAHVNPKPQSPTAYKTKVNASPKVSIPEVTRHNIPVNVVNNPNNKPLRDVIVVLDAGHGGKDPGAKGPRKSREKDVVLAITLKLKQLIDRQPGMKAVLTRSGDYYVGLRQRLDIARKYNGDIFVSIHADAFNNPHSNGASVFALSQSGATSEAARWIAEKENYSELGGVNLGELDDSNGVVRSVLLDLSQTATINAGLQMGGKVLRQLDNFTTLHNNRVEQARFVVLKSPDIPSILVETGFISNPIEERNLTSPAYQTRLSQAVFQGIKGYFWENPPHGSRLESMISSKVHWVKAGENLPGIAARYKVSISAIQSTNQMNGRTNLRPGQKLVIPSAWS